MGDGVQKTLCVIHATESEVSQRTRAKLIERIESSWSEIAKW